MYVYIHAAHSVPQSHLSPTVSEAHVVQRSKSEGIILVQTRIMMYPWS